MSEPIPLLIGDIVARNAAQVPRRMAAWMAGDVLSHGELNAAANHTALALRALGIGLGDRVAVWADTQLALLPLFAALSKLGAVYAPLNPLFGAGEVAPVARLARASLLIVDPGRAAAAREVAKAARIGLVAHLGAETSARWDVRLDPMSTREPIADVDEPGLRETDPHVIFFTSGSTGTPKGVVLSHRANHLRTYQGVFVQAPERSVCMFPLFHMAGFTLSLSAWQTQGCIGLVGSATAENILEAVQAIRANRLYCIPAIWNRILEKPGSEYDTSHLRCVDTGTSATSIELVQALKARFPQAALRIYYGSTECGAGTALADADVLLKPGSVGLPAPGVDLRLSEENEVWLRSPYLMDGYFDAPDKTAEVLRDGWFRTGDLGALDDDGYLSIVGRLREIIRTGGESFAPGEVEGVLEGHPDVAEVAVVGVPDAQWGEIVCAAVVAVPGATLTLADLQKHCEGTLAPFKKPRRLELLERLPRTAATQQVQRSLVVDLIVERTRSGAP